MTELDELNETVYAERILELKGRIHSLSVMKDAQEDDSGPRAAHFQEQINDLTDELIELETFAPRLLEADRRISDSDRRYRIVADQAEHELDQWFTVGKTLGIVGVLGVLFSLLWVPTVWIPILAALCLAGSIGAFWWRVRIRAERFPQVQEARENLDMARRRREAIDPGRGRRRSGSVLRQPPVAPVPDPAPVAAEAGVLEDEPIAAVAEPVEAGEPVRGKLEAADAD